MKTHYDFIVAGGGFTGVAAAIGAAREGLKVLLIEKEGYLGGAAVSCLVNPFMKYSILTPAGNGEKHSVSVNQGIFSVILDRLQKIGGIHPNRHTFHEEYIKLIFDRLCAESGVDLLFHSMLIDSFAEQGRVKRVTVANKGGRQTFEADYFIDCTGDADLAVLSGCGYHLGREEDQACQPMTLCFRLNHVNKDLFFKNGGSQPLNSLYQQFQKEGKIKNPRENILIFENMSDDILHFNTTRIIRRNPTDSFDLSAAEREAREQVFEMYLFLKEHFECFKDSQLLMSAPQIGVRESRMIQGEYVLTAEDLLSCVKFEDSIARGAYEVDIHNPDGSGTTIRTIPEGEYYTIPYRALIPEGYKNLLVAGRCISSTHEAQSAYRILPIVCCMGEGAGIAAAAAFHQKCEVSEVDIPSLHRRMDQVHALY